MFAQRQDILLNNDWNFRFSHQVQKGTEVRVDLPHTWNAQDALSGKIDYKRGIGNYEKNLFIRPEWKGKRLFIRFEGVNNIADVFINRRHIGEHRGGYGAFIFEITGKVEYGKENSILVRVNVPVLLRPAGKAGVQCGRHRHAPHRLSRRPGGRPDRRGTAAAEGRRGGVMVALACWLAILAIPALVWRFAPGPVRLNLRATVLWLPWYLLACTLLPALLGGLAGELATVLAGVYLLPFGCLAIGMSLGKRHGLCPLFPVVCALCLLIVVGKRTPALCLVPSISALLGNAAGAYPRERGGTG